MDREEYLSNAKVDTLALAYRFIDDIPFIEGIRELRKKFNILGDSYFSKEIDDLITLVDSETDHIPTGDTRLFWSKLYSSLSL